MPEMAGLPLSRLIAHLEDPAKRRGSTSEMNDLRDVALGLALHLVNQRNKIKSLEDRLESLNHPAIEASTTHDLGSGGAAPFVPGVIGTGARR